MYSEYLPSTELLPYIDKYWVTQGSIPGRQSMRIAADGCVDIIFASGDAAYVQSFREFHPYIVGTMDTYSEVAVTNNNNMLGIRFKPIGITAFIKNPVNELTNITLDLFSTESLFNNDFYLPLSDMNSTIEQLEYIDCYLRSKLSSIYKTEERIQHIIQRINAYKGIASVRQLTDEACLSPRQFERLFKSTVGIPAKTFSRIIRFRHTKEYLRNNPDISLFSAAIDCGYFDHSHLIKEFNTLAGDSPSLHSI